jgi:autotransporter-associated beta strand protein
LVGALLLPSLAQAQSVWGGTGSTTTTTNYNLGTNWSNPPGAAPITGGQSAQFGSTGSSTIVVTAGPISPDSWTFNANAQSYTISGQAVSFGGAGLVNNANAGQSISVSNNIGGAGSVSQAGVSTLTLSGANSYTGGTTISAGQLTLGNASALGLGANTTAISNGTLDLGGFATVQAALNQSGGTVQHGTMSVTTYQLAGGTLAASATVSAGTAFDLRTGTVDGVLTGTGLVLKTTAGTVTLNNANIYTGGTTILAGQLTLGNAGALGAAANSTLISNGTLDLGGFAAVHQVTVNQSGGTVQNGTMLVTTYQLTGGTLAASATVSAGTTFDLQAGTVDGVLTGAGTVTKTTAGTVTLNGINSYTGGTNLDAGTLQGIGTVNALTVNAGTFAPGNGTAGSSMTVNGSLAFLSAAVFAVQVNPTTASFANVIGNATLGGATVSATFAPGTYVSKQYTIVHATGTVSGAFNPSVVNTSLPSNFHTTLSYDTHDAYLNLALNFAIPGGLNTNQQNVANSLTNFFNTTGSIPLAFGALSPAGLTQASGEVATGTQQTTFDAMSLFLGLLTDPFIGGRGDAAAAGAPGASSYAPQNKPASGAARDAYAAMYNKAPVMAAPFTQRWSVWAAGYGGSQTTDGNATLGSNSTTSSIYGTAVGADYRLSPDTLLGFALGGGGTSFSVANALGAGRSDLFQAGAFIRHNAGPAYVTGALAYGWQDVTTNRTVTVAGIDQLRAQFNANAWSGRVEGGYRFVTAVMGGVGLTPYAAGQFTTFDLPAYAEQAISGSNAFALAYGAKSVTASRSELGLRSDKSFATADGILTLRGRIAWSHDYNPDRSIGATFQTLPGASFVVNGAAQARDAALVTASAEKKWLNGWSAAGTFEGEFSNVTKSYAGKGVVRYAW